MYYSNINSIVWKNAYCVYRYYKYYIGTHLNTVKLIIPINGLDDVKIIEILPNKPLWMKPLLSVHLFAVSDFQQTLFVVNLNFA